MLDLREYLLKELGIVISDDITVHILWVGDFRYFVHTITTLLMRLKQSLCFGTDDKFDVYFNEKVSKFRNINIWAPLQIHHLYVTNLLNLYSAYRKKVNFS